MQTAVLIHGCHLGAKHWANIAWGDPQNGILGRAPKGIQLALEGDCKFLIWGTGASERDGMKESEFTLTYAAAHHKELACLASEGAEEADALLRSMSYLDTESQNTEEEILNAVSVCIARNVWRLKLVSSPVHISRCYLDALKLREAGKIPKEFKFAQDESDTNFADSKVSDVVIIEPPHRGDMPAFQTHRYAKAMFGVMRQGNARFAEFLRDLGELLKKYGVHVDWKPVK